MKVILKQDVEKVGSKGDIVSVAAGFGRNYLIPRKLAVEVTATNVKMIGIEQQALKKKREKEVLAYQELAGRLNQVSMTFKRKAGEKDVIFGSVQSSDIKEVLDRLGFEIDKKKIILVEPIKRLGTFTVPIKIHLEERAEIKVVVVPEEQEAAAVAAAAAPRTEQKEEA